VIVKSITQPITGLTFRLGRRRPLARGPRLSLKNYLMKGLPTPPPTLSYSVNPPIMSDVLGNDANGCCTISGAFHIDGALLGNANTPVPPELNAKAAVDLYYKLTGGPDSGLDEQTVLNYWAQNGLLPDGSHKIVAWAVVDGSNIEEIQTALWLFENLYFGIELPDAWINPFPSGSGFTWDVAGPADQENGHCFMSPPVYDATGPEIDTWGYTGKITYPAIKAYTSPAAEGELYTVLSDDSINLATLKAPNGLNAAQLRADIASISS
jgi:hypothetical protein